MHSKSNSKILYKTISNDQTGLVKDVLEELPYYINIQYIAVQSMVLLIDFEKAFDSLSWNFIEKALYYCKISIFLKWIKTFYDNSTSKELKSGVIFIRKLKRITWM